MMPSMRKLMDREDLSPREAEDAMKAIMSGNASEAEMAGFLVALRMKGESAQEISSFAKVMREYSTKISPKVAGTLVDVCGTGGDGSGTFNISTAASFIVAGAGIPVAKHGNRSMTSKSGSADVLEALGARIDLPPKRIEGCIEETGIGFMFAPLHHPAMKSVMPVRKQLAVRTVFNVLGPLTNPAGAKGQLMGVFEPGLTETLAEAFRIIGLDRALVVHGRPGLDELSTAGSTRVSELRGGKVRTYEMDAGSLGLRPAGLADLAGGSPAENAADIRGILSGQAGPKRDIAVLNAAGGIIAGSAAGGFGSALRLAEKSVDSGAAAERLDRFIAYTRG
jgi:anthranilate phosphoribosyltransferase